MSTLNIYQTCCTFALITTIFAPHSGLLFTYPEQTKALVTVHLLLQHQDYGIHCLITFLLQSPLDNSKDCRNIIFMHVHLVVLCCMSFFLFVCALHPWEKVHYKCLFIIITGLISFPTPLSQAPNNFLRFCLVWGLKSYPICDSIQHLIGKMRFLWGVLANY